MTSLPGNPFHEYRTGSDMVEFTHEPSPTAKPYYLCIGTRRLGADRIGAHVFSILIFADSDEEAKDIVSTGCEVMIEAATERLENDDYTDWCQDKIRRWRAIREATLHGEYQVDDQVYVLEKCEPINPGQPLKVDWASNC